MKRKKIDYNYVTYDELKTLRKNKLKIIGITAYIISLTIFIFAMYFMNK